MVRLDRLAQAGQASVLAKLEYLNPGGSVKDRIAQNMIQTALAKGQLQPGMGIVEATSGNTGIGLAMICAELGYRLILTMPETMSFERRSLAIRYGAEVVLTPGKENIQGAVHKARQIAAKNRNWIELRQFENPANPQVHRETTGPEILNVTGKNIAAFVAGVGTGGTITGVGEVLKENIPDIKIIAVEPASSAILSGQQPGSHAIEGIGAGFIPPILNRNVIDEVITIEDGEAFKKARELAQKASLMVGISSGAALLASQQVAARLSPGQNVVTILPDTGFRYFSVEEFLSKEIDYDDSILL